MLYEEETVVVKVRAGEASFSSIYGGYERPFHPGPNDRNPRREYSICVDETSDGITSDLLAGTYYSVKPNSKALVTFKSFGRPKILMTNSDPRSGNLTNGNEQLDRLAQKLIRRDVQNLNRNTIFHEVPLRFVVRRTPVFVPLGVGPSPMGQVLDEDRRIIKLQLESVNIPYIGSNGNFIWLDEHGNQKFVSDFI